MKWIILILIVQSLIISQVTEACNKHNEDSKGGRGGNGGSYNRPGSGDRDGGRHQGGPGHHPGHGGPGGPGRHPEHGRPGHGNRHDYGRIRRARSPNGHPHDSYYIPSMAEVQAQNNYDMRYDDNPTQYPQSPVGNAYVPPPANTYSSYPDMYPDYGSQPPSQAYPPVQSYPSRESGEDPYRRSEPTPYDYQMNTQNGEQRPMDNYEGESDAYNQPNAVSDPQAPEERRDYQNAGMDPYAAHQAEIERLNRLQEERMRRYEEEKARYYAEHSN